MDNIVDLISICLMAYGTMLIILILGIGLYLLVTEIVKQR